MKRITISIPIETDEAIYDLRKSDEYKRCSKSDVVRKLLAIGLQAEARRLGKEYAS